jgi:hypothetical protein
MEIEGMVLFFIHDMWCCCCCVGKTSLLYWIEFHSQLQLDRK